MKIKMGDKFINNKTNKEIVIVDITFSTLIGDCYYLYEIVDDVYNDRYCLTYKEIMDCYTPKVKDDKVSK